MRFPMLDRYIGIAGLVIGILSFIAPYQWHNIPPIITSSTLYIAIALIGAAAGMFFTENISRPAPEDIAHDVSLFLQFSDLQTVPKEVRQTNVLSWYALFTDSIFVNTLDENKKPIGGFSVPPSWSIFVLFKKPASYRQMLAVGVRPESLKCAVPFSNDRYAIITATGDVTRATLDISTIPL
jgi:hypothetical protein